jgi:hypothetical protein
VLADFEAEIIGALAERGIALPPSKTMKSEGGNHENTTHEKLDR